MPEQHEAMARYTQVYVMLHLSLCNAFVPNGQLQPIGLPWDNMQFVEA